MILIEALTKADLQQLIGVEFFDEMSSFIEKLTLSGTADEELILYTKKNLVRLLLSMGEASILCNIDFWKKNVFAVLSEEKIGNIEAELDINVSKLSKNDVLKCIAYEYKNYDIDIDLTDEEIIDVPAFLICSPPEKSFKSLKKYQIRVSEQASTLLDNPKNRFIVQMPTGSGKTRTAMEVICNYLNDHPNGDIVWLAHSGELIEQAIECFTEIWSHIGRHEIALCVCDANRNGLKRECEQTRFVVSTLQKAISFLKNDSKEYNLLVDKVALVIVDEAHKSTADKYRKAIEKLLSKGAFLMGLTATPGRSVESENENTELANFYFNNIVEIKSPEHKSVFDYLRDEKILSKVKFETITGSDVDLSPSQIKSITNNFKIPDGVLKQLADEDIRNLEIVSKLHELSKNHKSIILFACSIKHSKFISSVCNYLGISSAHIDGNTPGYLRKTILSKFVNQSIKLISNYGVLSTGFDAPKTDVVVIARPTASIVLYSQMIGRGLRGPQIGGTKDCLIVNVKDNLIGMPEEDEIFDYFSEYYVN